MTRTDSVFFSFEPRLQPESQRLGLLFGPG